MKAGTPAFGQAMMMSTHECTPIQEPNSISDDSIIANITNYTNCNVSEQNGATSTSNNADMTSQHIGSIVEEEEDYDDNNADEDEECNGKEDIEEGVALDMDYDNLMAYFDNLKESNA
jgi:hypothetical protein